MKTQIKVLVGLKKLSVDPMMNLVITWEAKETILKMIVE